MNDIGKELYERVRADFERRLAAEKHPPKDMRGVSDYSARVGRYLAEAIAANVTEDALPDGRLYYNIAGSILSPSLRTNYELVNDTAAEVQRLLDERRGLRIKPARADYPEERVHAVIGAASEEGIEFDRALRRLTSPAENITQSFADDFMQANAEQRSRAGFDTFIERQGGLNCCPWCAGLVGVFAYPKGLPKEVFARHDNCTCSVTYGTKGGARQNAWTKAKWNVPSVQEPHRMTAEEAAEKGAFDKPKRLTGGANGGIIGLENERANSKIDYAVPKDLVISRQFRQKFDSMHEDKNVQREFYQMAKEILKHRSGNDGEDLYFYNQNTHKWYKSTEGTEKGKPLYTDEILEGLAKSKKGEIISFHNHPTGMPPSDGDLNAAFRNGYARGYTIGHDGRIFEYTAPNKEINEYMYAFKVASYIQQKMPEYDAQLAALKDLQKMYHFEFREVI